MNTSPITASSSPMTNAKKPPPQAPIQPLPNEGEAGKIYRENQITAIPSVWTLARIKQAIAAHELGMFAESSALVEAMTGEDRIARCLNELVGGCLRLPFRWAKARDTKHARRAKRFVAKLWKKAVRTTALFDLCRWALMIGFGVGEIIWDQKPSKWTPIGLKIWHPRNMYWREDIRRLIVQTADGPVEVTPGNGKWVVLSFSGERSWMDGLVRQLWRWWILRDYVWRDWGNFSEVMGHPIVTATAPASAEKPDKDRFYRDAVNMGARGVAALEKGPEGFAYDIGLLEAKTDHSKGFSLLLDRCEANETICILGQNATSQNDGAYVARGVFSKVTLDRIDSLVGPLEEMLCEQICEPICDFNFGKANLAPTPQWDSEPPPDKANFAAALMATGQFLETSSQAGYRVSAKELSRRLGIRIKRAKPLGVVTAQASAEATAKKTPPPQALPHAPPPAKQPAPAARLVALIMADKKAPDHEWDEALEAYAQWRDVA